MVVLFLLLSSFPLQPMPGITLLDPAELLLFPFLLGGLFLSFLSPYLFKGGSGSLFFVGCHLDLYIALYQFRGRDNGPPGWLGGGLQVGNCRALVVQLHRDGWGKTRLSMGACLSFPLSWPSYGW